ncbi:subtilisin-like protein [Neoconidiobolus thromboides FSU 785]|nr:subtilisin-like protein [Neoconidiobolus thromboides FSU 785]
MIKKHQQQFGDHIAKNILDIEHQEISKVYKRRILPKLFHRELNKRELEVRELQARSELNIRDPGFSHQWHILNKRNKGNDLNLLPVWERGLTGKGITVAFVDDGLDHLNEEFSYKYDPLASYDFNTNSTDPIPKLGSDSHGTRCAGEVSAAKDNACGVGIAYNSKVSGIRALSAPLYAHSEASALSYRNDLNDIYSCSWGPQDDGQSIGEPSKIAQKSIINSITNGRQGRGNVYVFASGNGGLYKDNCNFDGYVNSIYTIAVGAIDRYNKIPKYSEGCSALLLVTYSGDDNGRDTIFTTDVNGKCTSKHSGTSAAGPLISGVVALALEARPDLSWRDIQHLIIQNSVPVSLDHPSWATTYVGRPYSNMFGYGKMDASRFIDAAIHFQNVRPQTQIQIPTIEVDERIPETNDGLLTSIIVTPEMVNSNNFDTLEHVTIKVNIKHDRRRDVEMELISPNNIVSKVIESRPYDKSNEGFEDWTVMTVKHFDEPIVGEWKLKVKDIHHHNFKHGKFINYSIIFYGQSKPIIRYPSYSKLNRMSKIFNYFKDFL